MHYRGLARNMVLNLYHIIFYNENGFGNRRLRIYTEDLKKLYVTLVTGRLKRTTVCGRHALRKNQHVASLSTNHKVLVDSSAKMQLELISTNRIKQLPCVTDSRLT
jgi:hypothetical protein